MKKFIDFEKLSSLSRAIDQVLGMESVATPMAADLVIVDSPDKVLHYIQKTDKKIVQFAYLEGSSMAHLVEDYPDRLRVVAPDLVSLINGIMDLGG